MKKLFMAILIAILSTNAMADIFLDGMLSEAELFDYNSEVAAGDDVNGVYSYNGSFYDTMVDTSINLNTNSLTEAWQLNTTFTDTGATSLYNSGGNQTAEDLLFDFTRSNKRDFGFNAKVFEGTIVGTNNVATFTELANGNFVSDERVNFGGTADEYTKKEVMFRIGGKITNLVEQTDVFGTRLVAETEYKGISAQEIRDLNSDYLTTEVTTGQTSWKIAKENGLSLNELYELNPGLKGRFLKTGEQITVRDTFEEGYQIKVRDWSASDIDGAINTRFIDKDEYLRARYAEVSASSTQIGYKVETGNTAWTASRELGVSLDKLYSANDNLEGRFLQTGEFLYADKITFTDGQVDLGGFNGSATVDQAQLVEVLKSDFIDNLQNGNDPLNSDSGSINATGVVGLPNIAATIPSLLTQ